MMFRQLFKKVARTGGEEHEMSHKSEVAGEPSNPDSAVAAPETEPTSNPDKSTPKESEVLSPGTNGLTDEAKVTDSKASSVVVVPSRSSSSHELTANTQSQEALTRKSHEEQSAQGEQGSDAAQTEGLTVEKKDSNDAEDTVDEQNDDSKYPGGATLVLLTFGLCLATFIIALDNTIIATAIPHITTVFNSLNDVGWYGSSYLLTTTSLQPSFGKIYTYFDVKWTYLCALLIFELGSILCAAATSSEMLIVGRAVAGAGAAALFSGAMTIIGYSVALRQRAIYIAMLASMFGIASVVGPILGGVLTDRATWRWCFWINLPFGGVALLTVFFFFKSPERRHTDMTLRQKIGQIDLVGAALLICAVVCLLLALQWGGIKYPWHDSRVWGCLLGFGLILAVFIGWQFKLRDRYQYLRRTTSG